MQPTLHGMMILYTRPCVIAVASSYNQAVAELARAGEKHPWKEGSQNNAVTTQML